MKGNDIYYKGIDFIYEDYQYLLDVYEFIHLIKPKKPINFYYVYFIKNYNKLKFNNIKDLYNNYNNQSFKDKEKFELFFHRLLLGFKFKNFYYNKKNFLINKSKNYNQFSYFNKSNDYIINHNNKTSFQYLAINYNNLNKKDKIKNLNEYNNQKLKFMEIKSKLNNYIFDMPNKTTNIFNFYIQTNLKKQNEEYVFNKQNFIKLINEWKQINKTKYIDLFNLENIKYETQIQQFEICGYYNKNIDLNNLDKIKNFIQNEIINFYCNKNDNINYKKFHDYDEYINYIFTKLEI